MERPNWIKVAGTERDLFEMLDLLKQGRSIYDIVIDDNFVTVTDIRDLLMRTSLYLENHLVWDSYLNNLNQILPIPNSTFKLEWSANEIHELVNLHLSGAEIKNIAQLIRKDMVSVQEKLYSLNLINKGVENG